MKVVINPYPVWFGPHRFVSRFMPFLDSNKQEVVGDFLTKVYTTLRLNKLVTKIHDYQERNRVKVRVDYYDTWNADHTLALIIVPVLKKLRDEVHGSPGIDDEDIPERFRDNKDDVEFLEIWQAMLDEMIWAFQFALDEEGNDQYVTYDEKGSHNGFDFERHNADHAKATKGRMLFAKYYHALWD